MRRTLDIGVENHKGEFLALSQDPRYEVTVSGVSPSAATVNMSKTAMNDGAKYNSSRVNERNIVLAVYMMRDVEAARVNLYHYFPPKRKCTLYFKNGVRKVRIDGFVETLECDLYELGQYAQVSVLCPDPYFQSVNGVGVEIGKLLPLFEFPFAIEEEGVELSQLYSDMVGTVTNEGDVESGMVMELFASGKVTNPRIYNTQTRRNIGLSMEMQQGDVVTINTHVGEKSVTLLRGGIRSNIINRVAGHPAWLQLETGRNAFTYKCQAGDENLHVTFRFCPRYMGV